MLTDPRSLKPSLGREGWYQRMLAELILGGLANEDFAATLADLIAGPSA